MKLFRNIILVALPFLVIINVYRFLIARDDLVIGFQYFIEHFATFEGLSSTVSTFEKIKVSVDLWVDAVQQTNVLDWLKALFDMISAVFWIPVAILTDICYLFGWIIGMLIGTHS